MRASRRWAWGWVVGVAAAGCDGADGVAEPDRPPAAAPVPPAAAAPEPPALPVVLPPPAVGDPVGITPPPPLELDAPFADAVAPVAPAGASLPPERTAAGKPTAALRVQVEQLWPGVRLTTPAGEVEPIRLTLTTDLGPVEIAVFPEHAPNHVRNLLVLAHLGYYDGLAFERVLRADVPVAADGGARQRVEVVTFGSPTGDGDRGRGHLGYFLRREPSRLDHVEGTVGFVRGGEEDSACCRLYVCTAASPALNERFTAVGVVTKGLDTVRAIAARPVKDAPEGAEAEPAEPVKVRSLRVK